MNSGFKKEIGRCGLACMLCNEKNCSGCADAGCPDAKDCIPLHCSVEKGLAGCRECSLFPCGAPMLQRRRNRAFIRYMQIYGEQDLIGRLRKNAENGVIYHLPDSLTGDYDAPNSEAAVMRLIRFGTADVYDSCPELHTGRFLLRLVREEDLPGLLRCYADPKAWPFFNSANCSYGYGGVDSPEKMRSNIRMWLSEYQNRAFVRFSIVDQKSMQAIGSVEMFADPDGSGMLRLDLSSAYEKLSVLMELYACCRDEFPLLFGARCICTMDFPGARSEALAALGFLPSPVKDGFREWLRQMF